MTYEEFYTILSSAAPNVSRDSGEGEACPYTVYSPQPKRYTWANNRPAIKVTPILVEYFTRNALDGAPEKIEDAFSERAIPFEQEDIDHDHETGITRFAWMCEVIIH